MKTLNNKLIIYDSNCKVCSSLRDIVLKVTTIPEAKVKAYMDLVPELSSKVDPEKFKNVMALIDLSGGNTIYGAEGVAYIFSSQYRTADILLRFRPFFLLFSFLYKVQAYNRYIIATPKSKFHCDCFPDKVISFRLAYIGISFFFSVILTALFGISLKGYFHGMTSSKAAFEMLLIAGSGWVLQIILAFLMMKKDKLEYIGHLGSIMVVGLLILLPSMLLSLLGVNYFVIPVISIVLSSACMLSLHITRIRYLQLSQWWSVSWLLYLQLTAIIWIFYFHLGQVL